MTCIKSVVSSKYKGVSWHSKNKKWVATIYAFREKIYLGSFQEELIAAKAYNKAAIKLFGKYAKLNEIV